jgi:ABC-type antimicrobial peptide transport system permease subunit
MTLFRLVASSLRYHARIHAAVALGVLAATAVLTGALLVGDSMRGSLTHLTLDRLGRIDELLIVDRFFRAELGQELAQSSEFSNAGYRDAVPAILLASTSIESQQAEGRRASGVLAVGSGPDFWQLGAGTLPEFELQPDEVVLNEPLAEELVVKVGDTVVLRLPSAEQVPADSPLGRKENLTRSVPELKVVAIIPATGMGRFALRPNQVAPRNAYVATKTLQDALEQPGRVNALLVAGPTLDNPPGKESSEELQAALAPTLADYGLTLRRVMRKWNDATIYDYYELTSDRMLLDPEMVATAQKAFAGEKPQVLFTYLANRIERVPPAEAEQQAQKERGPISYSTICAVDSNATLGPALDRAGMVLGPLRDDEIILNDWAQRDQEAVIGDKIRVTYFEPETTHGEEKATSTTFTLRGITPLFTSAKEGDEQANGEENNARPTLANDPNLTPEVKGVTDAESISKWDAPFPVDYSLVRPQDDDYWEQYRTTPKAFVSLSAGQKLWGSRWGNVTAVRFPAREALSIEQLERDLLQQMRADGVTLGFDFQPIKRRDLAASSGTTPFDALFLGLSFFIVAAAVMLVVLLFRLGVEQRASEIGVLLGLGWTRRKVSRWLIAEGAMVAALGAAFGVLAGIGYAWLMLVGLRTWWLGAVATPFLELYITPLSLGIGYFAGVLMSVLAIYWGLRQTRRVAIRRLLAGQASEGFAIGSQRSTWWNRGLAALLLAAAIGLAFLATRLQAEAQAGAFLGCGAAVLTAALLLVREQLQRGAEMVGLIGRGALARLALRSAARNPSRSLLTLGLVGSAGFLIVALSAFRLDPSKSGSGGFELVGESSQAVLVDLNQAEQQEELLADEAALLKGGAILSLRLQPGDDASCRNLYQPTQPRVLGVPPTMIDYYDDPAHTPFAWSASGATSPEEQKNPWRLLAGGHSPDEPVPVVIDQNTAMYSLHLYGGAGEVFPIHYPNGQTVQFKIVGLLSNSVLQGSLLIGEADFKRLFPQTSGYRFFLIHAPAADENKVSSALEQRLSDQGLDVKRASDILIDLMAVQNTYLSTFQTLGALGLVLGTFGLAAVQLRSVLERRGELGLLRAAGFRKGRLAQLVMLENIVLLIGGLLLGVIAALIAVLPHMLLGGAKPPLTELAGMLGLVVVVGCLVGLWAVRSTLRAPLIASLRGE